MASAARDRGASGFAYAGQAARRTLSPRAVKIGLCAFLHAIVLPFLVYYRAHGERSTGGNTISSNISAWRGVANVGEMGQAARCWGICGNRMFVMLNIMLLRLSRLGRRTTQSVVVSGIGVSSGAGACFSWHGRRSAVVVIANGGQYFDGCRVSPESIEVV